MRFTIVSGVFGFVALAQGAAVPDANSLALSEVPSTDASLVRRDNVDTTIHCGCGFTMDPTDTDHATQALYWDIMTHQAQSGSDTQVPALMSWWKRVGSVVAFACNKSQVGNRYQATTTDFNEALQAITAKFGRYIAGSRMHIGSADQPALAGASNEFFYGYQRWEDGPHPIPQAGTGSPADWFCANADSSGAHSCS